MAGQNIGPGPVERFAGAQVQGVIHKRGEAGGLRGIEAAGDAEQQQQLAEPHHGGKGIAGRGVADDLEQAAQKCGE